jgi:hypothetical protein
MQDKLGCNYYVEYFEEPKGNVPAWAVTMAMDKAVDSMVEGIRRNIALQRTRQRTASHVTAASGSDA